MEKVENYNVSDAQICTVVDHLGGEQGMIPYVVLVDKTGRIVFAGMPALRKNLIEDV